MKVAKRIGICMDHSAARVMENAGDDFKVQIVEPDLEGLDNHEKLQHSESLLHHKENQSIKSYYKALIEIIRNYDEILLFGPTNAKTELFNLIREDHKYDALKIEIKPTDKMNYEEQHTFMKDHFSKLLNYESPYSK